jgi:hypothetical protein
MIFCSGRELRDGPTVPQLIMPFGSEGEAMLGDARMKWSVVVTRTLGTLSCSRGLGEDSRLWRTMWRFA